MQKRQAKDEPGREKLAFPDAKTVNNLIGPLGGSPATRIVEPETLKPFPPEFLSIDAQLATDHDFRADNIVDTANKQFQFWQMESLADQAADLLDRCATERAAYDALRSKWAKLILDVLEFEQTEQIHELEIKAGWYTINHDQSEAEKEALGAMLQPVDGQVDPQPMPPNINLGALLVPPNKGYLAAAQMAAASYTGITSNDILSQLAGDGGPKGTVNRDRHIDEPGIKIQQAMFQAQADSATAALAGKSAKEAFDKADIDFRRQRSQLAITMNELRKKLMSDSGADWNYPEQMGPIKRRFMRDFRDGYMRLLRVRDGLNNILGIQIEEFPEIVNGVPIPIPNPDPNAGTFFDQALRWSREAIRQLIVLSHTDQTYSLSVSIRQTLGEDEWKAHAGKVSDVQPFACDFDFPVIKLAGQHLVRLRGITSFVVTKTATAGVWAGSIRPPQAALAGDPLLPLDQSGVPQVFFGRVGRRDNPQQADVAGTTVLRNVSALGNLKSTDPDKDPHWHLEISSNSNTGDSFKNVDDIHLDFVLTVKGDS